LQLWEIHTELSNLLLIVQHKPVLQCPWLLPQNLTQYDEEVVEGPTLDQRDKPDIVAPGSAILVACSRGDTESRAGTSYSAAIVSSVIALCRNITSNPQEIKNALMSTAVKMIDPDRHSPYDKNIQGKGRIDVDSAYSKLSQNKP
jgi:subtilisin family serine protease